MQELLNYNKITLVGYYGKNNLGDDMMLESILKELPNHEVKILAFGNLDSVISNYKNVREVFVWPNSKVKKVQAFLSAIKGSEAIVWGGGTCFTDEDGDGFFKYMPLGKLLGKKIIYSGIGVGNLSKRNRKAKANYLIKISDFLSLRDDNSYAYVRSIRKSDKNISLVEDLSIKYLESKYSKKGKVEKKQSVLLIGWRNLDKYKNTTIGNNLRPLLKLIDIVVLEKKISQITLIDVDSSYDREINIKLSKMLNEKYRDLEINHFKGESLQDKLNYLEVSSVVITSRLHLAVICDYLDIDCYMYNYSPKMKSLFDGSSSHNLKLIDKKFDLTNDVKVNLSEA